MPFNYDTWGGSWGGSWGDSWGTQTRPGAPALGDEDRLWRRLVKFKSRATIRGAVTDERYGAIVATSRALRVIPDAVSHLEPADTSARVSQRVEQSVRAALARRPVEREASREPTRIVVYVAPLRQERDTYGMLQATNIVLGFEDEAEDGFSPLFDGWDDDDDE